MLYIFDFIHQNWMAFERYPPSWKAKESSEIVFSEKEVPTAQNNYSLCKVRIQIYNVIRKAFKKRFFLVYDNHVYTFFAEYQLYRPILRAARDNHNCS